MIRRVLSRLAGVTVAINRDVADSFGLKSEIIPNSVDLTDFHPRQGDADKQVLGFDPDIPVVTYFGFLSPSKGFREFIVAARAIIDRRASLCSHRSLSDIPQLHPVPGADRHGRAVGRKREPPGL